MSHPRLRITDTVTGEILDECPACRQYERDLRVLKAEKTRMEEDSERKAREDKRWAEAECAHEWWRLATGHFNTKFTVEDFKHVVPRLKERGIVGVLKAIAGAAYDPGSKTMKNGRPMVYDDWELLNRSKSKADNFALRAPGESADDDRTWRIWLVNRIESNMKEQESS